MEREREVVIVGAARTPTGKLLGALSSITAPGLGAVALRAAVERAGVSLEAIDEVFVGNVVSAGVGQSPARQTALAAGIPVGVPATTINNVCGSGLKAVMLAAQAIRAGDGQLYVGAGTESMSNAPFLIPGARQGLRAGHAELLDANLKDGLWCAIEDQSMGVLAEATAREFGITRGAMDELASASHQRAVTASRLGWFHDEIAAVTIPNERGASAVVAEDEPPRADCTGDTLGRLRPAFQPNGRITAGNAPGLSDGAAAVVVMERTAADATESPILARIVGAASVALEPGRLFLAPPLAIRSLLERHGLAMADVDLFELNEAFAAQVLANAQDLGWDRDFLRERVNVHGGAIALGHPIGASGARILVTLVHAMKRRGAHRGIAALCHGGGGAVAVLVERE